MSVVIATVILAGCGKKSDSEPKESQVETPIVQKSVSSVCVWDKASVRMEPLKKGKWLSSLVLGEKVSWLGQTSIDSSDKNRKYELVRLSDGKEGWVSEYVIAIDAKPAAVKKKTAIYMRPDLMTASSKSFNAMDLVAVIKTEKDWVEVVGEQKKKKGWLKTNSLSLQDVDITVSLLTIKALAEKTSDKRSSKIGDIINNSDLAGSAFINNLREIQKLQTSKSDSAGK